MADYSGLANNDHLILGSYGQEKSELVQIYDGAINTDIDLTAAVIYAHPANTIVQKSLWNEYSLESATSETGSFSVLGTGVIQPDEEYTYYNDSAGVSTTWYKVRYYNDYSAIYSDYSDAVQAIGYKDNSRGRLRELAKSMFGDKYEKWCTDDDWNNFFYQTEQEVFTARKKWSFLQSETSFELSEGKSIYALSDFVPTLKENSESYIDDVWVEDEDSLIYNDRKEFDSLLIGAKWTKLTDAMIAAATTAAVVDADMLDTTGTVYINGDEIDLVSVSGTTLTVSNVSAAHSAGDEVWMVGELDEPTDRTVWGGNLMINPAPDTAYVIHIAHQKDGTVMDEDNDVSEIPRSTNLLLNGVLSLAAQVKQDNTMYQQKRAEFLNELTELKYQERTGQKQFLQPSRETGYRLHRDYEDFDKAGGLWEIKNKYRSS